MLFNIFNKKANIFKDEVTLKNYGREKNSFLKLPVAKNCQKQYTVVNNFTSVTFGNG